MDRGTAISRAGAAAFALALALWSARVLRDIAERRADDDARAARRSAKHEATDRAMVRQPPTLARIIRLSQWSNALVPTIGRGMCEELTNCEVRYGQPRRTLVWTLPRIPVPAGCTRHIGASMADCMRVAHGSTDGALARCFPEHGWLVRMEGAYTVRDGRQRQLTPGRFTVQCDQGYTEGTFAQAETP
jgi:hypothetical protein